MKIENATYTTFVKELKIAISRQSIIEELEKHPFPSFLSISYVLNNCHIPNTAALYKGYILVAEKNLFLKKIITHKIEQRNC